MAKDFTLDDYRRQLDQIEKKGGMKDLLSQMPALSEMVPEGEDIDLARCRIRQIIDAMTDEERRHPDMITSTSRSRIAAHLDMPPQIVEEFLAGFQRFRAVMRQMAEMSFL